MERIEQIKEDISRRFPARFAILLRNALDWVEEHLGPEKALEEAEYLHTIGLNQFIIAPDEVEEALEAGAKERAAAEKTLKRGGRY